jgi:hypothetical protein
MLHPANRLGQFQTPAAALLCALAVLPMSALALCNDALNCTTIGTDSLVSNTTGANNTAIGRSALGSNTTGSNNTAGGFLALFSNTTGVNNTASGFSALRSNTEGSSNTASGVEALLSNTTGGANTASGAEALGSNTTGSNNTASGRSALFSNTTGNSNTANGVDALVSNTTGGSNTASGVSALRENTEGSANTASGVSALRDNTTGSANAASGFQALLVNTTGRRNVAVGTSALRRNTTGSDNIALGNNAGSALTAGVNNIHIGHVGVTGESKVIRLGRQGTQLKTFIAGIRGTTASGAAVVVSNTGQLGVVSSSRRYKENIQPMADASAALMKLKPVTFRYKEADEGQKSVQFGLIAEEVAEVLPELVVRDEQGQPETVAYHVLPSLLLNEYQKQQVKLVDVETRANQELAQLRDALATRDKELVAMRAEMKALRQVTQQLMAAMPNATSVGMTER